MKKKLLTLAVVVLMATSLAAPVWAETMPTDPIGGKPPADTKASFTNFESFKDQVLYQRAFEAVLWSVPIVQKLGMRRGTLAIGGDENAPDAPRMIRIHSGASRPDEAFVTVQYRDNCFWIDDTDLASKRVFSFLMMLMSLTETGAKTGAPIVTVPTN